MVDALTWGGSVLVLVALPLAVIRLHLGESLRHFSMRSKGLHHEPTGALILPKGPGRGGDNLVDNATIDVHNRTSNMEQDPWNRNDSEAANFQFDRVESAEGVPAGVSPSGSADGCSDVDVYLIVYNARFERHLRGDPAIDIWSDEDECR